MKLYVECCKSKDKDSTYHALKCDFGYRVAMLSMEKDVICECADVTMKSLYNMKAGDIIEVGEVIRKVK